MTLLSTFIKTDHTIKQNKCQHAKIKDPPPLYLHNLENYKQFMREKGDSEEAIRDIGILEWNNATFIYQINYDKVYGKPCPYKFPYEPWRAVQAKPEKPVKKLTCNTGKKNKLNKDNLQIEKVQPEIRIRANTMREILTMGLSKLEYEVFFIIAIEILQWKYHRDNDYTAKLGPSKIAKLSGKIRREQATRTIKSLEKRGLIKIIQNKKYKDNRDTVIQLLKY